mgnify:FL=1
MGGNDREGSKKEQKKEKRNARIISSSVYCCNCNSLFSSNEDCQDYNTEHLELISGLYAEKMNETIDYLQSYAKENVKTVRNIEDKEPEEILARLERDLDQTVFCDIGFL